MRAKVVKNLYCGGLDGGLGRAGHWGYRVHLASAFIDLSFVFIGGGVFAHQLSVHLNNFKHVQIRAIYKCFVNTFHHRERITLSGNRDFFYIFVFIE